MRSFLTCLFTFLICLFFSLDLLGQSDTGETPSLEMGPEIQIYPTGIIPGIRIEKYIGVSSSIHLRVGYQIIDHRDFGVQEDETGSGYGASLAYRKFFNSEHSGLSLALRTDLWFNTIDWESNGITGVTDITVVQPTLMGEYRIQKDKFSIAPSLSFGWEWNVSTDGEPTGEGPILLVGCTFGLGM